MQRSFLLTLCFRQTSTSVRSCQACARGECASTPLEASSANVPEATLSTQTPESAKVSECSRQLTGWPARSQILRRGCVHWEGNSLQPPRNGLMWERWEHVPCTKRRQNNNRPPCLRESHYLMCRHNSLSLFLGVAWPDSWIPQSVPDAVMWSLMFLGEIDYLPADRADMEEGGRDGWMGRKVGSRCKKGCF